MKKWLVSAFALILSISIYSEVNAYEDVPETHSNYEDIQYLLEKGIISDGKKYGINDIVTREEVAVMIAKAVGLEGTPTLTVFRDVRVSNPNSGYIQSAVENGIIKGYDDNTFRPNDKVTRGHMATFIARTFDLPNGTKTFKDVKQGSTAYEAVSQLAAAGITTGYGDNTFKPNDNLTRGHISAFLARAMKSYEKKPNIISKVSVTEDRLWSYLDSPYDFKGEHSVRIEDVYLTSEFLRIIVSYRNRGVDGGSIFTASNKINGHELDIDFNLDMKDKYYHKDAPVSINFLDDTATAYQFFKPDVVDGDTVDITIKFWKYAFEFEDIKVRK